MNAANAPSSRHTMNAADREKSALGDVVAPEPVPRSLQKITPSVLLRIRRSSPRRNSARRRLRQVTRWNVANEFIVDNVVRIRNAQGRKTDLANEPAHRLGDERSLLPGRSMRQHRQRERTNMTTCDWDMTATCRPAFRIGSRAAHFQERGQFQSERRPEVTPACTRLQPTAPRDARDSPHPPWRAIVPNPSPSRENLRTSVRGGNRTRRPFRQIVRPDANFWPMQRPQSVHPVSVP